MGDEEMYSATLRQDLELALQDINWREAEISRLYFGIGRDRPMTLVQIGIRFELTRERVRMRARAAREQKTKNVRNPNDVLPEGGLNRPFLEGKKDRRALLETKQMSTTSTTS